jgi:CheB methylesterase
METSVVGYLGPVIEVEGQRIGSLDVQISAARSKRAMTIAQDEAPCTIFGMPKEAIQRGAVAKVLPFYQLAAPARLLGLASATSVTWRKSRQASSN